MAVRAWAPPFARSDLAIPFVRPPAITLRALGTPRSASRGHGGSRFVTPRAAVIVTIAANIRRGGEGALEAQSCFEVRRLLGEHAEIDVVITDVSLDDGNWFNVLTLLADRTDETSLLVLSRGDDERFRQMVCSRGADGLLWGGDQATHTRTLIEEACRDAKGSAAVRSS